MLTIPLQFGQSIDSEQWSRSLCNSGVMDCTEIIIYSGANPDFSSDELFYQLEQTKACLVIAHPDSINTARSAVQKAKLPLNRLIVFDTRQKPPYNCLKIESLIEKGSASLPAFVERKLNSGEAKTKLAFLSFSSGTTGKPKVIR
ncbi:hypothetical protein C0993_009301 [Termitomyces sp. T159_Od127]|nr:hypothetical protein C0993_009301 [Termitomyces sp. T159_Od127]